MTPKVGIAQTLRKCKNLMFTSYELQQALRENLLKGKFGYIALCELLVDSKILNSIW